ncbi:THO complex subunit 4D-like [Teleopsis dalmanni]|uniref:THO complex subunit 4D-like n=1 Tax=Teleopsis dalmanni TaxID=139649 RepID=UPI0018CF4DCB|nr:THO complex subunit 4D-like [Teleopsis dalmanni]
MMDFNKSLDELIAENKERERHNERFNLFKFDYNKSLDDIIADKKNHQQKRWKLRRNISRKNWIYKNRAKFTFKQGVQNYAMVMIYNVNKYVTNDDLHTLFEDFGVIIDLSVHYNNDGQSLGIAHILYKIGRMLFQLLRLTME